MPSNRSRFRRLIRSTRVRAFVVISVLLHALFFGSLAVSEDFRHFVMGNPNTVVAPPDASASEVQAAVRRRLEMLHEHLTNNVRASPRLDACEARRDPAGKAATPAGGG